MIHFSIWHTFYEIGYISTDECNCDCIFSREKKEKQKPMEEYIVTIYVIFMRFCVHLFWCKLFCGKVFKSFLMASVQFHFILFYVFFSLSFNKVYTYCATSKFWIMSKLRQVNIFVYRFSNFQLLFCFRCIYTYKYNIEMRKRKMIRFFAPNNKNKTKILFMNHFLN